MRKNKKSQKGLKNANEITAQTEKNITKSNQIEWIFSSAQIINFLKN